MKMIKCISSLLKGLQTSSWNMSNPSDPVVIVWPMCQFQKDYETFEKIGEGHYGKVYSAKRRESNIKRNKGHR